MKIQVDYFVILGPEMKQSYSGADICIYLKVSW